MIAKENHVGDVAGIAGKQMLFAVCKVVSTEGCGSLGQLGTVPKIFQFS